jgi:hypothetical protein
VERADEIISRDLASVTQVGAEVRAVGVEQMGVTSTTPVENDVLAEEVEGPDLPKRKLIREADVEPAVGKGRKGCRRPAVQLI